MPTLQNVFIVEDIYQADVLPLHVNNELLVATIIPLTTEQTANTGDIHPTNAKKMNCKNYIHLIIVSIAAFCLGILISVGTIQRKC